MSWKPWLSFVFVHHHIDVNQKFAKSSKIFQIVLVRMHREARQVAIASYLQDTEFASLEDLAVRTGASVSTVRRDLSDLEAQGLVRRTHGGARSLERARDDESGAIGSEARLATEKDRIASACADLVEMGSSVILDAGTTVHAVARRLRPRRPQIVTNSLLIANQYASDSQIEVVVSGGVIYPRLGVLVGPSAVEAFANIHVDYAIMSAGGLTEAGVMNSHALLIDIQREMLRAAKTVVMCLDHSKFDRKSMTPLCDLRRLDVVITDREPSFAWRQRLDCEGVQLVVSDHQPERVSV